MLMRLLLIAFLFLSKCLFAQDYYLKTASPHSSISSSIFLQTTSSGEQFSASSVANTSGHTQLQISNLNKCGNVVWSKTFEHQSFPLNLVDFKLDKDNNLILLGHLDQTNLNPHAFLLKVEPDGDLIYFKKLDSGNGKNELTYSLSIAPNGDYLIYGLYDYRPSPPDVAEISLMRLTKDASIKWFKSYPFSSRSWGRMIATSDNGALAKTSNQLFKVDSLGNVEWAKAYTGLGTLLPHLETDSSYVFFMSYIGAIDRALLFATDKLGNIKWNSNTFYNFYPRNGLYLSDSNQIVFSGLQYGFTGNSPAIGKYDASNGDLIRLSHYKSQNVFNSIDWHAINLNPDGGFNTAGVDSRGIFQQLAFGRYNDTLSLLSCEDTLAPDGMPDWSVSNSSDLNVQQNVRSSSVINEALTELNLSLPQMNVECSFTRSRGNHLLGNDTLLCPKSIIILGDAQSTFDQYIWSTGENTTTILVNRAGDYHLSVISACDTLRDTISVSYYPNIGLDLGNDTSICHADSILLSPKQSHSNYLWNNGSTTSSIWAKQKAWYWVETQTNCGTVRDSIYVDIFDPVLNLDLGPDTTLCFGDSLQLNPGAYDNYLWSTGSTNSSINIKQQGEYWLMAGNACKSVRDSVIVNIYPEIVVQISDLPETIFSTDTFNIINLSPNLLSSSWYFENTLLKHGNALKHAFSLAGNYSLELRMISTDGCFHSYFFNVEVKPNPIQIPNIFSPNSDGINDEFSPLSPDLKQYKMRIFNRWGDLVFYSINTAWDGRQSDGLNCEIGSYFYLLEMQIFDDEEIKRTGFIQLQR